MADCTLLERTNTRIEYFDFFRAIAAYAIVVIHTDSLYFYSADLHSVQWHIINVFDSITRWAVPVFMMMSGALFLRSRSGIKKILSKNVLRIVTAFFFWSTLYTLVTVYMGGIEGIRGIILQIFTGHYHMWYLQVVAVLYLATPVFRKIAEHQEAVNYTLVISLLFSMIIPQIMDTISLFCEPFAQIGQEIQNKLNTGIFTGAVFYFFCGYELSRREISARARKIIYILGVLALAYTIGFSALASLWKGQAVNAFYTPYRVNSALMAMAVFVYGKYHFSYAKVPKFVAKLVNELSGKSFGIYLVHVMVIELAGRRLGMDLAPAAAIPLISVSVFIISYVISAVIQKIPVLKKYIV